MELFPSIYRIEELLLLDTVLLYKKSVQIILWMYEKKKRS